MTQDYLIIDTETNVVDNIVMWDGTPIWNPPANHIAIPQSNTPAKVWEYDEETQGYVLAIVDGAGSVGFLWDGTFAITNEPMPEQVVT